jgi:pimeloyl-ACP methyl ester carboxylesterase
VSNPSGFGLNLAPVVFIPGMIPMQVWGKWSRASACAETVWNPNDHHSDIAAIIHAEKIQSYHLIAHSMGSAYGLW